jgi:hypothetical protein
MKIIRSLILAAAALLLPFSSFAALRGVTSSSSATGIATSNSITYSGAGSIQVGDLILLVTSYAVGGSTTFTDPSGFSKGSTFGLPDMLVNSDTEFHVVAKIAAVGDVGTPTYVTSDAGAFGGQWNQQLRVYSGRVNSSIAAAFGNSVVSTQGASANTPISYSLSGITALAGDDIIEFAVPDVTGFASGAVWSQTISGWGNALVSNRNGTPSAPLLSLDLVNSSGGATGTLASTISATATSTAVPKGFVISLPQATGGGGSSNQSLSLTGVAALFHAPAANDPRMAMDRLIVPILKKVA